MKMPVLLAVVFFLVNCVGCSGCNIIGKSCDLLAGSFLGRIVSGGQESQPQVLAQDSISSHQHTRFREAVGMLYQTRQLLPSDSMIIDRELARVKDAYAEASQEIKKQYDSIHYVGYEARRLINLCYTARNIPELEKYEKALFEHVATYSSIFENYYELNNDIAQCIVNSYESQSIWFKDSLLHFVIQAAEQHMESLNAHTWSETKQQDFINMYAAHYYQRGIVSMAEPFFRHFREVYGYEAAQQWEMPVLTAGHRVLSSGLSPTNRPFASFTGNKILMVARQESPYNLIYLITQLRTAREAYPNTPVFILRDPGNVSNSYLMALGRNLAFSDYYIIDFDPAKEGDAEQMACCYHQIYGELAYSTNNPVDFLEWLEKPLEKQMQDQKRQLQENYQKLQERNEQRASMPVDNTIKYTVTSGLLEVNFRGYWDARPRVKVKQYHFMESDQGPLSDHVQLAEMQIFVKETPVYSTAFIFLGDTVEVDITADAQHRMRASFYDKQNRDFATLSGVLDSILKLKNTYAHLLNNYPFTESSFYQAIEKRQGALGPQVQDQIARAGSLGAVLLAMKYNAIRLQLADPVDNIGYEDFVEFFPDDQFHPIVWRSPYYQAWVQSWLAYGRKDIKHAVDWLFGSEQLMPEEALSRVGGFLWKQMNAQGRFDVMVHMDTTWLAGCPGTRDQDVQKRMEGYKRMATGNRAPNISWDRQGETMDLYSIEADTIVVVFWSDGCAYCKQELPAMHDRLKDNPGFEVVAVAVDPSETSVKTGERVMPSWHHVRAKKGWDDPLVERYNVFGTPEMYLLDRNHVITEKRINF